MGAGDLTQWLGRFSVAASTNAITVEDTQNAYTADDITVASGRYYIAGYTGEATDQFCEALTALFVALPGTDYDNCTFTYSGSTGKVTFTNNATTTLTFNDSTIATILGFTSSPYSGASTYTAENEARYGWRPDRPLSDHPTHADSVFAPLSMSKIQRAPDGSIATVPAVAVLYEARRLGFRYVDGDRVRTPTTGTVYQDFEQFYEDVIAATMKIRMYPDRTVNTSSDYVELVIGDERRGVPSFERSCRRSSRKYDGLWDVMFPVMKAV